MEKGYQQPLKIQYNFLINKKYMCPIFMKSVWKLIFYCNSGIIFLSPYYKGFGRNTRF